MLLFIWFQSPVALFGSEAGECGSPIRKSFVMTPNNNSIATINQQLSNLGTINQQLTQLSQQLSGLNQQSQHLQQFQNIGNNLNTILSSVPNLQSIVNSSTFSSNTSSNNCNNNNTNNNNNNNINANSNNNTTQNAKLTNNYIQSDLFQSNQELLNRLQSLSLGFSNNNSILSQSPNSSTLLGHILNGNLQPTAMNCSTSNTSANLNSSGSINHINNNNNNSTNANLNLLSSPSSIGNLTPSPVFNRSPCSISPMLDAGSSVLTTPMSATAMQIGAECTNHVDDLQKLLRPISATPLSDSMLTIFDTVDKFRPATPIPLIAADNNGQCNALMTPAGSQISLASTLGGSGGVGGTIRKNDKSVQLPDFTLHITDECGNIMNNSKRPPSSATPSALMRTTSEKVSSRSQLMNEVQRTAWARHTTK